MRQIEAADPHRRLAGLEHMLKKADRLKEKVRADVERLKATRFEVQFHTEESLQAKELTHGAYERLRRPENETTPSERDELEEFQLRANALLATPRGSEEINDFPERNR